MAVGATLGVNAESNEAQPVGVVYLYEYKHDHKAWVLFQTIFAGDGVFTIKLLNLIFLIFLNENSIAM